MEIASQTARIRELNDGFRCAERFVAASMAFGQVVITRGVEAKGNTFVLRAFERVRTFDAFTKDNDPYGEHDFGNFELDGETVNWKIDYYDPTFSRLSEDPADALKTQRVLTILLAEEY